MLAQLIAQAEREGGSLITLRALVEEACEAGAARALGRIGLHDEAAGEDVRELRQLIGAWRDAKRSALRSAIGWLVRGLCALLLMGLAIKFGVGGRLET